MRLVKLIMSSFIYWQIIILRNWEVLPLGIIFVQTE